MAAADGSRTPRTPAGAALPRESVTRSIHAATLEELAQHGYGRLSVEAVARRAGVGKAAIYRRWPSKVDLAVAVLTAAAVRPGDVVDTGSLRGDVLAFLLAGRAFVSQPLARRIIPDLVAEATRTPELDELLTTTIGAPRRELGAELLRRAVARDELRQDVDFELAMDFIPSALYWRLSVRRATASDADLERLADATVAALRAL